MATITTPNGHVFSFDHNSAMKRYSAVGPLFGGKLALRIESSIRVCSDRSEPEEAREDLINQLASKGY